MVLLEPSHHALRKLNSHIKRLCVSLPVTEQLRCQPTASIHQQSRAKETSHDSVPKLSAVSLVLNKSCSNVRYVRETTVVIILSHYILGYVATDNRTEAAMQFNHG